MQIAGESAFRSLRLRMGGWSAGRVTWGLVALVTVGVLLEVIVLKASGGLALSSYDAMVQLRVVVAAPDPRHAGVWYRASHLVLAQRSTLG